MKLIDVHVHLLPDNLNARMRKWLRKRLNSEMSINMDAEEVYWNLKERGVEAMFNLTHAVDPVHTYELNKWQEKLKMKHPDIYTFGSFHPSSNVNELPALFKRYKLNGLKLHPGVQRFLPNSEKAMEIYRVLERENKPLIIHSGYFLDNGYLYTHPKFYSELVEKFSFPVILSHMCYEYFEYLEKYLDRRDNVYTDCSLVMIREEIHSEILGRKVRYMPPSNDFLERYSDRILYGSEMPIVAWDPWLPLKNLLELDVSEETKKKILYSNARKLIDEIG